MKIWQSCALVLLHTCLLLGLCEVMARTVERARPDSPIEFDYAPHRMVKMVHAPWALNRDGFRALEWGAYKDRFVVEFLGGSVCLGVGTSVGRTVPERLESDLQARGLERVAVVNLCQGGATSGQELAIFLQYGLPLLPKYVISFDGANDLFHPSPIGTDAAANLPYLDAELRGHSLFSHAATLRLASRALRRRPSKPEPVAEQQAVESYLATLMSTRALARDAGAEYAVALQPTLHLDKPWSEEESRMWRARGEDSSVIRARYVSARESVHASRLPLYDLSGSFSDTPETIYSDSVHFANEKGNQALYSELVRLGLVERIQSRYREWLP